MTSGAVEKTDVEITPQFERERVRFIPKEGELRLRLADLIFHGQQPAAFGRRLQPVVALKLIRTSCSARPAANSSARLSRIKNILIFGAAEA